MSRPRSSSLCRAVNKRPRSFNARWRAQYLVFACLACVVKFAGFGTGSNWIGAPASRCLRADSVTSLAAEGQRLDRQSANTNPDEDIEEEVELTSSGFISAFAVLTAVSALGLVFYSPRFVASLAGIQSAGPVEETARSFGINAGVSLFFAFLAKLDFDRESERQEARRDEALAKAVQSLPIQVCSFVPESQTAPVQMRKLLLSQEFADSRVVLCIGNRAFCSACVASAARNVQSLEDGKTLLVPMPVTLQLQIDEVALTKLAEMTLARAALPEVSAASAFWPEFCEKEFAKASDQGIVIDFADDGRAPEGKFDGLCILLGKGPGNKRRVEGRFMGDPDWVSLATPASYEM